MKGRDAALTVGGAGERGADVGRETAGNGGRISICGFAMGRCGWRTEEGVANSLVRAGVPKQEIVLGFQAPMMRKMTEFAVA